MANVKRRLNAPERAPKNEAKRKKTNGCTQKELKLLQSVTDVDLTDGIESSKKESGGAKKRKNAAKTPYEKYSLMNKLKDLNHKKTTDSVDKRRPKQTATTVPTPELPGLMKTKTCIFRSSKYLKIMDNVLKQEFGIQNKHKKNKSSKNGVINNNESEIINQNNETIDKTSKLPDKNNRRPSLKKSSVAVSAEVLEAPAPGSVPDKSKSNKQQTVLVNFTDELSPPTPPRKRGRPRKDSNVELSHSKKIKPRKPKVQKLNPPLITRDPPRPKGALFLPLFECDYCNKIFNRKHSLVRHVYLHLGKKPHKCPVCPKKFRLRNNMKNHVALDHCVPYVDENMKTYSCNICDKPFFTEENLKLHITSHATGENSFKCIYCDKKFAYQLLLIQHEKQHLVTGKYLCTLCDIKFKSRDKLYVHVKSHLKLIDYICQYCGREFLRANSMKRHVQTMHRGRTIQCPVCNKSLKGHLTEHMRTHNNKRPHKCPDCGKLFAQSTQLKVHRRGHTGSRPYICRICDRPFSHSNALMLHLRRHTGEKPFPCAECPLSFSQLPHMKAHMAKIHNKIRPYKCLKCGDYFKLKKDLVFHKKTCSGTGIDTDLYGDLRMYRESQDDGTEDIPSLESTMTLSRMRFLLALLLTMISTKEKLKYLGFNKRLVDDLLVEALEAMDQVPCSDETMTPLVRLRTNIEKFLKGTVPSGQMAKFRKEKKSTEELLELLTSEKDK